MNTHGYFNTCVVGTHEGTGRTQVWYLSNGAGTGIILSVPIDIPTMNVRTRLDNQDFDYTYFYSKKKIPFIGLKECHEDTR